MADFNVCDVLKRDKSQRFLPVNDPNLHIHRENRRARMAGLDSRLCAAETAIERQFLENEKLNAKFHDLQNTDNNKLARRPVARVAPFNHPLHAKNTDTGNLQAENHSDPLTETTSLQAENHSDPLTETTSLQAENHSDPLTETTSLQAMIRGLKARAEEFRRDLEEFTCQNAESIDQNREGLLNLKEQLYMLNRQTKDSHLLRNEAPTRKVEGGGLFGSFSKNLVKAFACTGILIAGTTIVAKLLK